MKIETRDPQDLALAPARKAVPALPGWEKDGERFIALVENIRLRGIDKPLLVDAEDRIIDGDARWRAAKQLQLTQVPVIVRAGDAASILVAAAATKKRLPSQSALAYYTFPLMAAAWEECRRHQLDSLRQGARSPNLDYGKKPRKIEDFAEEVGVGRQYLFDAKKVHEAFDKHPEPRDITDKETGEVHEGTTFREYYGRRILLGEVRLGAVMAGIEGHLKTRGREKVVSRQLELFQQGLRTFVLRALKLPDAKEAQPAFREIMGGIDQGEALHRLISFAGALEQAAKARTRELANKEKE